MLFRDNPESVDFSMPYLMMLCLGLKRRVVVKYSERSPGLNSFPDLRIDPKLFHLLRCYLFLSPITFPVLLFPA